MTNAVEKPKWIPVQEMIREGTIGFTLVSQIPDLGARPRPETTFQQPLSLVWGNTRSPVITELQSSGLSVVRDLLYLTDDQLSLFDTNGVVTDRLRVYLEGLSITPHARLLAAIFGENQYPIPMDREGELIGAVEEAVSSIASERYAQVIRQRFGLSNGIRKTLDEIGGVIGVSGSRVRQVETKALRFLRHPTRSKLLKEYLSLPEESFGREILGAVFEKECHGWPWGYLGDLSPAAVQELPSADFHDVFRTDLKKNPLSPEVRVEVGEALRQYIIEHPRLELSSTPVVVKPIQSEVKLEELPSSTVLTLGVTINAEKYKRVSSRKVEELTADHYKIRNLLKQRGISTVAQLLSMSMQDVVKLVVSKEKITEFVGVALGRLDLFSKEELNGILGLLLEEQQKARRESDQKKQDQDMIHMNTVRELIQTAVEQGITKPEDIQGFLISHKQRKALGLSHRRSWTTQAMIEYVLNHPEEGQEISV